MKSDEILLFFAASAIFLAIALLSTTPRPPIKAGAPGYERGNFIKFASDEHYFLLKKCGKTAFLKDNVWLCADCENLIDEQAICENPIS